MSSREPDDVHTLTPCERKCLFNVSPSFLARLALRCGNGIRFGHRRPRKAEGGEHSEHLGARLSKNADFGAKIFLWSSLAG